MTVSVVPVVTGAQETCLANVSAKVDSLSQELRRISLTLHENPELCYEEFIAHETVCAFLETQTGWEVTRAVYGIETAFLAIFENGNGGESVSFNAEYGMSLMAHEMLVCWTAGPRGERNAEFKIDALPGIGHACGHNLIAVSSIGAALAVADVMVSRSINGKVYLIGTPAEEGGM
jgi:metal-dependent amidase/aminoacylase/carboxypeptidase family protein